MLTKENYFSLNNGYLTNSKIGDFLKCPEYFYKKHITGEIGRTETSALKIGKGVDELLTQDQINTAFFVKGDMRTKVGKEEAEEKEKEGYTLLTKAEYESMMALAIAVERTDAYKQLKDFTRQEILSVEMELGELFHGIAGIPDFYKYDSVLKKCIIVDLKTSNEIEQKPYYYHCINFGYFRQMAMYSILLKAKFPDIIDFEYYHLVVDKTKDINHVKTFQLINNEVEDEIKYLKDCFRAVKETKKFEKYNPRFEDSQMLGYLAL